MAALVDDMASLIVSEGLGILGGDVRASRRLPEGGTPPVPIDCVFLYAQSGARTLRAMGPRKGDPVVEQPMFEVAVRSERFTTGEELSRRIHAVLDHNWGTFGGTSYLYITGIVVPYYEGVDEKNRHYHCCRYRAMKRRTVL